MTWIRDIVLVTLLLAISGQMSVALNCFSCLPNSASGQNCRQIAGQLPINCTANSKHCVAVVLGDAKGDITVYRGCGNQVSDFKLGGDECTVLDSWANDLPAAYYKCKTDACNNIEPVTTEVIETVHVSPVPASATG